MNIKYLLATLLIFIVVSCTPMPMYAQLVVADPASVSQRMTLFLEELSEALQERYSIEKQTDNTFELLKQNKETLTKLQNISNFVKTALVVKEIAEESNNVINKVKNISDKFSKLDKLTSEEVYNFLNFSIAFNEQVYDRFQESKKMSSSTTSSGEMTDYERLQILNNIKDEIVRMKKNLSNIESRFKKKNSYEEFSKQARAYTREALFMAFENKYDTEGIKKEKKSSKSSAKESNKKSNKKSSTTSKK